ncbi:hypothetical protein [Amycolatopsis sp. NPDC051061]|uniref:hypothetical protein n=1 Tax=Amycolatopsis sp. NPDC051061 TaxID=3155042 RepID=UPI003425E002
MDGTPIGLSDDVAESITLQFDTDSAPTHRCRACREELAETPDGYESTSGDTACADFEPTVDTDPDYGEGPHDPERIRLSWCNSATAQTDESEDSVALSISVGDPRGAFTFTIRRVPEDADGDLAGRLIMHTPYAGEHMLHVSLTPLHDGTYVVGTYAPTRRLRSVPPAA